MIVRLKVKSNDEGDLQDLIKMTKSLLTMLERNLDESRLNSEFALRIPDGVSLSAEKAKNAKNGWIV